MKALPWVLVTGLLCSLLVMRAWGDVGYAKLEAATAAIDSLAPIAEAHRTEAHKADTVLVHVSDTVRIRVETARIRYIEAADSLRPTLDSVQAERFQEIEEAHAEEVAALTTLADARLVWGTTWKDYAETLEAQNAQLAIGFTLAQGMLRAERRNANMFKIGAILVGTALVVREIRR